MMYFFRSCSNFDFACSSPSSWSPSELSQQCLGCVAAALKLFSWERERGKHHSLWTRVKGGWWGSWGHKEVNQPGWVCRLRSQANGPPESVPHQDPRDCPPLPSPNQAATLQQEAAWGLVAGSKYSVLFFLWEAADHHVHSKTLEKVAL